MPFGREVGVIYLMDAQPGNACVSEDAVEVVRRGAEHEPACLFQDDRLAHSDALHFMGEAGVGIGAPLGRGHRSRS
ncbi:unnamed protein product [Chondrus crispus]|uniref:Uncharacterized protein n=1 Tax=Chondrus crispus TaxID=2769 RepID=R7QJL7_CHOCR|nr:unnamed protein product [Chondrus crispus]CDF37661.1 unnamed protein product [Chondrus crispus]|eukprot:XP_005717532.1 unnamed protein product [Chondrus crispus]